MGIIIFLKYGNFIRRVPLERVAPAEEHSDEKQDVSKEDEENQERLIDDKFENVAFNFADLEDDEFYILKVIEKNEDAYSIPTFEVKCDLGAKGKKTIKYSVPQEASQWLPEPYNPTFKFERDIFTEEDENIPNGVSILLTYDIDTWSGDETVDGIVFYGDDIPPLKKTADTYPDAK